ncbi:MAG: 4Fe-4S dicluster domain-containing protein [Clostridiales bacterium]|jgi:epoxyqueuosine reductase|nr:4Fe-4S dicluster domain-containing protein [Clostridiales bacterium]
MLKKIIKHTSKPNMAYIVLGYSYLPYQDCGLDAYYLATQSMYKLSKDIQSQLRNNGSYAQIVNDVSLRTLAFCSGLCTIWGINQMAMREDSGSYIVLGAIETDDVGVVRNATGEYIEASTKCMDCKLCVDKCPTRAIGINGEFDPNKCLRKFQSGGVMPIEIADLMGAKFLGCDICQAVCPHNRDIQRIQAPQYVQQALYNSINTIRPFRDIIGANYARPKYLTVNSIVYSAHSKYTHAIPSLHKLSQDVMYAQLVDWAISKIED